MFTPRAVALPGHVFNPQVNKPGVMVLACNSSAQAVEA